MDWRGRAAFILGVGVALVMLTGCDSDRPWTRPPAPGPTPTWGPTSLKNSQDYCWELRVDTHVAQPATVWNLFTDHKPSIKMTSRGTEIRVINARVDPPGRWNSHYFSGEWETALDREYGAYVLEKRALCGAPTEEDKE